MSSKRWSCGTLGDGLDHVDLNALRIQEEELLRELEDRNKSFISFITRMVLFENYSCPYQHEHVCNKHPL